MFRGAYPDFLVGKPSVNWPTPTSEQVRMVRGQDDREDWLPPRQHKDRMRAQVEEMRREREQREGAIGGPVRGPLG